MVTYFFILAYFFSLVFLGCKQEKKDSRVSSLAEEQLDNDQQAAEKPEERPTASLPSAEKYLDVGFSDFVGTHAVFFEHDDAKTANKLCQNKPTGFLVRSKATDGSVVYGICLGGFSVQTKDDLYKDGTYRVSYTNFRFSRYGDGAGDRHFIAAFSNVIDRQNGTLGVIAGTIFPKIGQLDFSCDYANLKNLSVKSSSTKLEFPLIGCVEQNLTLNSLTDVWVTPLNSTTKHKINFFQVK